MEGLNGLMLATIDCIEPTILIDDSRVFLTQKHIGGHEIITFSYDEFITKYNLK